MKKRVVTIFITAIMIMSLSGCGIGDLSPGSKSDNASAVENVSTDEGEDNGSKDPDSAKSFKEYVELRCGPVAGDFDTEITVDDDKSWGVLEDKEYGFQYMINLDNGAEYKDCNTNFTAQYKSYINNIEDAALDEIEEKEGVSVEYNSLDSEFIVAELTLNDLSAASELTEQIGKIYEKYDNRHFFDRYLIIAKDSGGSIIGKYLIWHGYEPK